MTNKGIGHTVFVIMLMLPIMILILVGGSRLSGVAIEAYGAENAAASSDNGQRRVDKTDVIYDLPYNDVGLLPQEKEFEISSVRGSTTVATLKLAGAMFEVSSYDELGLPVSYTATAVYRGLEEYEIRNNMEETKLPAGGNDMDDAEIVTVPENAELAEAAADDLTSEEEISKTLYLGDRDSQTGFSDISVSDGVTPLTTGGAGEGAAYNVKLITLMLISALAASVITVLIMNRRRSTAGGL